MIHQMEPHSGQHLVLVSSKLACLPLDAHACVRDACARRVRDDCAPCVRDEHARDVQPFHHDACVRDHDFLCKQLFHRGAYVHDHDSLCKVLHHDGCDVHKQPYVHARCCAGVLLHSCDDDDRHLHVCVLHAHDRRYISRVLQNVE